MTGDAHPTTHQVDRASKQARSTGAAAVTHRRRLADRRGQIGGRL
jgi:hypothetical protein